MSPFTEQLRTAAAGFAGEMGLTLDDLGFVSDNPSSVEAIKASHENLRLAGRKAQRSLGSGLLKNVKENEMKGLPSLGILEED